MYYTHNTSGVTDRTIYEMIRDYAYNKYEARGCTPNQDLTDWLEAEHEIRHHFGLKATSAKSLVHKIRIEI